MKKILCILFTMTCLTVFTACRTTDVGGSAFTDVTWNIVEVDGSAVAEFDEQPCITFTSDGRYHGNSSVNNFFGEYRQKGKSLQLSEGGMTRKMGRSMQTETNIMQALSATASIRVEGDSAVIFNAAGDAVMKLRR